MAVNQPLPTILQNTKDTKTINANKIRQSIIDAGGSTIAIDANLTQINTGVVSISESRAGTASQAEVEPGYLFGSGIGGELSGNYIRQYAQFAYDYQTGWRNPLTSSLSNNWTWVNERFYNEGSYIDDMSTGVVTACTFDVAPNYFCIAPAYNGEIYVGIDLNGRIYHSEDGKEFSYYTRMEYEYTNPVSPIIVYNANIAKFIVCTKQSSGVTVCSTDYQGTKWVIGSLGGNATSIFSYKDIVVAGIVGTPTYMTRYTSDGINWVNGRSRQSTLTNIGVTNFFIGKGGKLIMQSQNTSDETCTWMESEDGKAFTLKSTTTSSYWWGTFKPIYAVGKYWRTTNASYAPPGDGYANAWLIYSEDLITWVSVGTNKASTIGNYWMDPTDYNSLYFEDYNIDNTTMGVWKLDLSYLTEVNAIAGNGAIVSRYATGYFTQTNDNITFQVLDFTPRYVVITPGTMPIDTNSTTVPFIISRIADVCSFKTSIGTGPGTPRFKPVTPSAGTFSQGEKGASISGSIHQNGFSVSFASNTDFTRDWKWLAIS